MDEITPEPVSPEFTALDAYLKDALRVAPLNTDAADTLTQAVVRRSDSVDGQASYADRSRTSRETIPGVRIQLLRERIVGFGPRTLRRWMWVAGSTVMLGAMLMFMRRGSPSDSGISRVYTTREGQQALVTLEDGTRVTLFPQTTLRLVHFGTASRNVVLDHGEAYFLVPHAAGAPFLVQSGAVTTRVLGTEFLIERKAGATRVRVAVANGKVHVSTSTRNNSAVTLVAGQVGDLTDSTFQVGTVNDIVPNAEWTPGQVVFRNTLVPNILQVLSRWYGYQFRYTDSTLTKQRITVGISTQSPAEALAALGRVLAVNLTTVGDTITLTTHPARSLHGPVRVRTYDIWTPTREVGR